MKNLPKHIQEKLTKVAALATQGIDGEKESAMELLEKLCKKYKIDISDVLTVPEEETLKSYSFRYSKDIQKDLLFQCIYKYKNVNNVDYRKRSNNKLITIELTKFEFILISEAYSYFSTLMLAEFKKMQDSFQTAFIFKHNLYGPTAEDKTKLIGEEEPKKDKMSKAELNRIISLANSMEDSNFVPGRLLES